LGGGGDKTRGHGNSNDTSDVRRSHGGTRDGTSGAADPGGENVDTGGDHIDAGTTVREGSDSVVDVRSGNSDSRGFTSGRVDASVTTGVTSSDDEGGTTTDGGGNGTVDGSGGTSTERHVGDGLAAGTSGVGGDPVDSGNDVTVGTGTGTREDLDGDDTGGFSDTVGVGSDGTTI
jgi:hypothetical protein